MISSNSKSIENNISINGVNLQKVDNLRFQTVCIEDQIILFTSYINCQNSIAIIHRASHVHDTKALYCLYNAILQPDLNDCNKVLGNTRRGYGTLPW